MKRALKLGVVSCGLVALGVACGGATVDDIYDTDFDGGPTTADAGDSGNSNDSGNSLDGAKQNDSGHSTDSGINPVDTGAPDTGPVGTPCTVDADGVVGAVACNVGYACVATDCKNGTCVKLAGSSSDYNPVCGCDTINYWNATIATNFAAGIKATGRCSSPLQCSGAQGSAECATIGTTSCEFTGSGAICTPQVTGTCWGLPDTCPTVTAGVTECGATATCEGLCDAIMNQDPYRSGSTCKVN